MSFVGPAPDLFADTVHIDMDDLVNSGVLNVGLVDPEHRRARAILALSHRLTALVGRGESFLENPVASLPLGAASESSLSPLTPLSVSMSDLTPLSNSPDVSGDAAHNCQQSEASSEEVSLLSQLRARQVLPRAVSLPQSTRENLAAHPALACAPSPTKPAVQSPQSRDAEEHNESEPSSEEVSLWSQLQARQHLRQASSLPPPDQENIAELQSEAGAGETSPADLSSLSHSQKEAAAPQSEEARDVRSSHPRTHIASLIPDLQSLSKSQTAAASDTTGTASAFGGKRRSAPELTPSRHEIKEADKLWRGWAKMDRRKTKEALKHPLMAPDVCLKDFADEEQGEWTGVRPQADRPREALTGSTAKVILDKSGVPLAWVFPEFLGKQVNDVLFQQLHEFADGVNLTTNKQGADANTRNKKRSYHKTQKTLKHDLKPMFQSCVQKGEYLADSLDASVMMIAMPKGGLGNALTWHSDQIEAVRDLWFQQLAGARQQHVTKMAAALEALRAEQKATREQPIDLNRANEKLQKRLDKTMEKLRLEREGRL
ncbi:hypothetical protein AURDEDRAFT_175249 [Auricularia subglabra TFB-10046 SS5]|nr:hypothetical protein AURDEDRAFT_175249 [Auricularia subglabra TFB-10046 SS5]